MLAPHHLIFSTLEDALVDSRTGSFAAAEEAMSELERRHIPLVLLTARTRAEIEPIRRELLHNHPFITESGGGIFFPDGYLNLRIPGAERTGRYLHVALGRPYLEVAEELDDLAEETGIGIAGFHHMSLREVADNIGLRPREAELARNREFEELFYFTSGDEKAIARFVEAAKEQGFTARPGNPFWHFFSGSDPARAIRTLTKLFREATRIKLRAVGIGSSKEDLAWLSAVDHAIMLPGPDSESGGLVASNGRNVIAGDAPGPAGWNSTILSIIS